MKPSSSNPARVLKAGLVAAACLVAIPQTQARDRDDDNRGNGRDSDRRNSYRGDDDRHDDHGRYDDHGRHDHDDHDRQAYHSRPRSSFTLSLGTGYAGRGYYYGPPSSSYYYQRPDVRYYATQQAAPRSYYNGNSTGAAVQRELYRRGYYRGSIDGAIGSQSRRAIAAFQRDNGLSQTGSINSSLLRSLGLQ